MAHNISILENGTACFVENTKKETAWHGLGTHYDRPLTALEALQGSHADFEVEKRDIFYMHPDLKELLSGTADIPVEKLKELLLNIEGKQVTVRSDNNVDLGVVSDSYGLVQNAHAFDFIDVMTTGERNGNTPTIECAGVLGKGERIFITAKFPEQIALNGGNDLIDMYIVFTTSHDGSGAVTCMVTPIRVVCNNTLNMAFSENRGRLSLRHTAHVMNRLDLSNNDNAERAFKTLKMYDLYKQEFELKIAELAGRKVSDKQIESILVNSLMGEDVRTIYAASGNLNSPDISTRSRNIIDSVKDSIASGIGQAQTTSGTAWWVLNGITSHYQNSVDWKDDTKKFDAIMDGSVNYKMQKAYELLMKL